MAQTIPSGSATAPRSSTPTGGALTPIAQAERSHPLPARRPDPVVASRHTLEQTASPVGARQQTVAGDGSVVPVIYGVDRYGGQFAGAQVRNTHAHHSIYLLVVWCRGPIQSITEIRLWDEPLPASVRVSHHYGTAGDPVDSTMAAACLINGITYTDTLPGKAYTVFEVPADVSDGNGFPVFSAKITGKKVALTSGGTPTYSNNPAYAVADFVESATYGMGLSIDWASVATVAARCAEVIGGEARRTINLTLDRVQPVGAWLETLCAYAGCQAINEAGVITLVANAPAVVTYSFTTANIVAGSLRLRKRGTLDVPTAVRVRFTNTAEIPYQEDSAIECLPGVLAGTVPRRESQVSMPGINRYSQARREAIEQLNAQNLSDLSASFVTFDEALAVRKGDVIDITHPVGATTNTLSAKKFRVSSVEDAGFGRYLIAADEYDAAAYSDEVITTPSDPDTN